VLLRLDNCEIRKAALPPELTWLHRLPDIVAQLKGLPSPVIDRSPRAMKCHFLFQFAVEPPAAKQSESFFMNRRNGFI
jgi:hypothetical protein